MDYGLSYVPASASLKYKVGEDYMNIFDFSLDYVRAVEVDLNSVWLCCGPQPERIFAGAWLLAPYSRVLAVLPHSDKSNFNQHQRKTYLRLWFIETQGDSHVDLSEAPSPLIIRIALLRQPSADLFLMVPGRTVHSPSPPPPPKWLNAPQPNTVEETWQLSPPLANAGNVQQQPRHVHNTHKRPHGAYATSTNTIPLGQPPKRHHQHQLSQPPPPPGQPPAPELLLRRLLEKQEGESAPNSPPKSAAAPRDIYDPDNPFMD